MLQNEIPFPQADDMLKIFKIINIDDSNKLKEKLSMQMLLGDISSRQVQYYLNAAAFLDVIDSNKEFTPFGMKLREIEYYDQVIRISQKIISNEIFGEVFFTQLFLGIALEREEIVSIMKKYICFNSDALYIRRAQTVSKWIEWINSNFFLNK